MHSFDLPSGRRLHVNGDFSGDAIVSPGEIRVPMMDVLAIAELAALSEKERFWDLGQIDSEMECTKAISGLRFLRRRHETKSAPGAPSGAGREGDMCQCGKWGARPALHATWCEVRIDWSD